MTTFQTEWAGYDSHGNDLVGHMHPHRQGHFYATNCTKGVYCCAPLDEHGLCTDPPRLARHWLVCVVPIFYHGHGYETVNTETGYRMRYVREYQAVCICGDRRPSGDRNIAILLHEFHVDEEGS